MKTGKGANRTQRLAYQVHEVQDTLQGIRACETRRRRRGLRAIIVLSPDDICSSDSEDNETSPVRHLRVHDGVLVPTTKTETVPVTLATTIELIDSSFFLKLILENQCEQTKFQSMMEKRIAHQE
jgi:hypothetical protein